MAPEQAEGKPREVGPAVDIYALGAVLYELLTGRPPFRGETPLDTMQQVLTQEPVPPRRLQPKVPRDLETICLQCLQKVPARRYASATALAEDLRSFLEGRPIQARPAPAWEWAVKWARRRPAVALLLAANILAPALLLGWYTVRLRKTNADLSDALTTANAQRTEAETNLHLAWQVTDDMLMIGRDWFEMTGWHERSMGKPHRMRRKILQEALTCHEVFIRTHDANPAMRKDIARAHGQIGEIHAYLGDDLDAIAAYRRAVRLCKDGMGDDPGDRSSAIDLVWILGRLSELQLRKGQAEGAVATYREAIQDLETSLGKTPPGEVARTCLTEVQAGLARTQCSAGRCAEALAAWDYALELDSGEHRDEFLAQQAVCRACLGDHAGAAAAARTATTKTPKITGVWYNAARAYAQCCTAVMHDEHLSTNQRQELAEQYAREALEQLRLAAADRMFVDFQLSLRRLETDKDLDPLRSRPAFQKLLAEQRTETQRIRTIPDR
jgi:tetratricopeptide (TPR) repeat protein